MNRLQVYKQIKIVENFHPDSPNFLPVLAGKRFAQKMSDYAVFRTLGPNVYILN